MDGQTTWTLGVTIGLPALALLLLALALFAGWAFYSDEPEMGVVAIVILVLVGGTAAYGYFPYSARYHQYRVVRGTVEDIGARLLTTGSGDRSVEQKYAVTMNGGQYGCEDTRCSTVRKGDTLTLDCVAVWQYAAADGYDCRFISVKKATA